MPPQGGQGALLEVTDGNYQRMSAVCPWWELGQSAEARSSRLI